MMKFPDGDIYVFHDDLEVLWYILLHPGPNSGAKTGMYIRMTHKGG